MTNNELLELAGRAVKALLNWRYLHIALAIGAAIAWTVIAFAFWTRT